MFKKRTINEYFDVIKKNHKDYLEANMVTHLDIQGMENKKPLISNYLSYIKNFHELKQSELDDDINGSTTAEKIERGTFSALLGMLLGGLFFAWTQRAPSVDMFGATTAIQGGFATAIGAGCGALIYNAWDMSNEKPAHATFQACEEEMQKAGFTGERYKDLSAELVKLFHFRECLLLGLEDKNNISMRDAFKNRYYSTKNASNFNGDDFDLAIEVYFLEQLDNVFHRAFEKIYQVHDKEIKDEQQQNEFTKWFKRHFNSTENRQKFTQQMQVKFIKNCMSFLENQMNEHSFLGKYLYLVDSIAGLITASLAVAIIASTILMPVFALACIAIAAASLTALGTHLTIVQTDSLYYERDKDNRQAIQNAIKSITTEQKRLATLLQKVVITTNKNLDELKKFDDENESSFLTILKGNSPKQIATGSVRAWIREFASRYNESKVVVLDLSKRITSLVNDAHDQTESLQTELISWMTSATPTEPELKNLTQFIQDTKAYLLDPSQAEFIKTFESVQKIKEQVLEIVGHVPSSLNQKSLPEYLVSFYTTPVTKGGLGGLKSDLEQVRRLAPVVAANIAADMNHPYQQFLDTAFTIQRKLNDNPDARYILPGDNKYRIMLGLPTNQSGRIEEKIDTANIDDYLNESFDFLCSLNQYENNVDWHGAFQNNDPFILYRMLLVKQLANLADPNNIRVDSLVKDKIKQFVRKKLNYNPDVAFDDILNQALLVFTKIGGRTLKDKLGNPRSLTALSFIADAIRVDMAYVSSALSPEQLIANEANLFLMTDAEQIIFGYNSYEQLTPELSPDFHNKINETINTTTKFIAMINTNSLLQQTSTVRLYLEVILREINRIKQQISVLKPLLDNPNLQPLDDVLQSLETFKLTLGIPDPLPEAIPDATPPVDPAIVALDAFIAKQNTEYAKEGKAPLYTLFSYHGHKREDKISAASKLIEALKSGKPDEGINWREGIYKTNRHLQEIIQIYGLEEKLDNLASGANLGI